MAGLFLTLGSVIFSALEIPQKFGPLGGKQAIVRHEFPGGVITQANLGAFPQPLKWEGILTGATAFARVGQIDRMRVLGADVTLRYGPFAWIGKIGAFLPTVQQQWLIPYEITFEPSADISGNASTGAAPLSAELALSQQIGAVDDIEAGDDGLALPPTLAGPSAGLDSAVAAGLQNGDGTVAGIPPAYAAGIAAAVASVQASSAPLIAGTDATLASPAIDLSARAAAVGVVVASPKAAVRYLTLINPNLFALAGQYLGDPTKWGDIAAASGLSDPQPVGLFTITVPAS